MTVEQLEHTMSFAELVDWQALDVIRSEERKSAEQQAKKGMKPRRGFRGRR